jgi:hypothetical protein
MTCACRSVATACIENESARKTDKRPVATVSCTVVCCNFLYEQKLNIVEDEA